MICVRGNSSLVKSKWLFSLFIVLNNINNNQTTTSSTNRLLWSLSGQILATTNQKTVGWHPQGDSDQTLLSYFRIIYKQNYKKKKDDAATCKKITGN